LDIALEALPHRAQTIAESNAQRNFERTMTRHIKRLKSMARAAEAELKWSIKHGDPPDIINELTEEADALKAAAHALIMVPILKSEVAELREVVHERVGERQG